MKKIALIFPGQGTQKVGMGRELFDGVPAARAIFEKANGILNSSLTDIIFNGPEEKLLATAYCQPAIFTTCMAALEAFKSSDKYAAVNVKYTAGLSLGEFAALCAAGALSFEETLRLIQKRGALMEEVAKANPGKMAAVIGFDKDKLLEIVKAAGCEVANFNSPDQTVITGSSAGVESACRMIAEAGGKKVIPLEVSGAFHSSLMKPAADRFAPIVGAAGFSLTDVSIVSNVTANPQASVDEIRQNLPRQIYSSVRWVESVNFIAAQGVTEFVEIGPGRVLKGLIRKINPSLNVQNVQSPEDIASLVF